MVRIQCPARPFNTGSLPRERDAQRFRTTRSYSDQNIAERSQFFHSGAVAKQHRKNKRPQLQARAKYCCRTEQEKKPHTPSSPKTAPVRPKKRTPRDGLYTRPVHMACPHGLYTWPVRAALVHVACTRALYTRLVHASRIARFACQGSVEGPTNDYD